MPTENNLFDHTAIDDVIHGRLRLGIMAYLSTVNPASFGEVRDRVKASDGNLSAHISKLEKAGYIEVEKRFIGKRPQTRLHLTQIGRKAWINWLTHKQGLIKAGD